MNRRSLRLRGSYPSLSHCDRPWPRARVSRAHVLQRQQSSRASWVPCRAIPCHCRRHGRRCRSSRSRDSFPSSNRCVERRPWPRAHMPQPSPMWLRSLPSHCCSIKTRSVSMDGQPCSHHSTKTPVQLPLPSLFWAHRRRSVQRPSILKWTMHLSVQQC
jgi:hypothetical protein